ncbi:MAG: cadherin-like domain-containing protein, partial [Planctomycetota bacterium]
MTEPTPNNVSDSIVVTINPTNDAPRLRNGARTVRMLFIGNSFSYQGAGESVAHFMRDIASSDGARGHTFNLNAGTDIQCPGGMTMEGHYFTPAERTLILTGGYDYVSLQGQSMEALEMPPYYEGLGIYGRTPSSAPYNSLLCDDCQTGGAIAVEFETWPWKSTHYSYQYKRYNGGTPGVDEEPWSGGTTRRWQDQVNEGYRVGRGGRHRVMAAHCGEAFLAYEIAHPGKNLYKSDSYHPNFVGRYLAACVFYETVFGVSSVGAPYFPGTITDTDRQECQAIATQVTGAPPSDPTGLTLTTIQEDEVGSGTTITTLLTSAGGAVVLTDDDDSPLQGVAITAADTTNGSWEYTTNGSSWNALGSVSSSSARLLADDGTTAIRFVPTAEYSGTLTTAITFRAWDQTSGSNGGTADTSGVLNGGSSAFSTETRTASLTVTNYQDPPAVTTNTGLTITQSDPATTITQAMLEATDPDNSANQLTYTVTAVPTHGTLRNNTTPLVVSSTFTQTQLNSGLINYLHGGSANPSDSFSFSVADLEPKSVADTFTITIDPLNPPSVTTNTGMTVLEGAVLSTINNSMLETTDADNAADQLTYTLTDLPDNGTVNLSGSPLGLGGMFTQDDIDTSKVTYTHNGGESTSDSFSFDVADPDLSTDSGTFSITVTGVNDQPTASNTTQAKGWTEGAASVALDDIVTSDGDIGELLIATLTLADTAAGSLSTGGGGSYTPGTGVWTITDTVANVNAALAAVTFVPLTDRDTGTSISVDVRDGEEDGAVPVTGTITLTVTPVNDQPSASNTTQAKAWNEGDPSVALDDIAVSDVDTGEVITATLTLADPLAGAITTGGGGSYTPGTGVWTITDSVANVNTALAAATFAPDPDRDTGTTIGINIQDGLEDGAVALTGTITLTVSGSNDAPVLATGARHYKVLFIGNSYTQWPWAGDEQNVATVLQQLAASSGLGHTVTVDVTNFGNATFKAHWQDITVPFAQELITTGGYDIVVMQSHSIGPLQMPPAVATSEFAGGGAGSNGRPDFLTHGELLVDLARANGARVIFFCQWPRRDTHAFYSQNPHWHGWNQQDTLQMTNDGYARVSEGDDGVTLGLGGNVWMEAIQSDEARWEPLLYRPDGSHQRDAGTYAVACALYEMIFGVQSAGLANLELAPGDAVDLQAFASAVTGAPAAQTGSVSLDTIDEDETGSVGTSIETLLGSAGGTIITDADSGALTGIAVVAADTANGTWEFSTNNGSSWSPLGAVTTASARLLAADTQTRVRFVPAADFHGLVPTGLTFRAWDRSSGSNGALANTTTNGGGTPFSSATETASVRVNPANDAPVLGAGGSLTITSTTEDHTDPTGTSINALLASAGDPITDVDPDAQEGIAVVGVDDTNGTWQFSLDGGSSWTAFGAVSDASARLLPDAPGVLVRFLPAADYFGTVAGGLTFRAWDRTLMGVEGAETADASSNGGTTCFSSTTRSASVDVLPVNDAPDFTATDPSASNEDAGPQTVAGWATFDPGPANEAGQAATYAVSNVSNAALFVTQPSVDSNGDLHYEAAADASGTCTFDVTVQDDGGLANGGTDTSATKGPFTITVNPVNDQPTASNTTQAKAWIEGAASVALDDIVVGDIDSPEVITATLTLADTAAGSLGTAGGGSYTPGTGVWTVSGDLATVNAALAAVTFDPATDRDTGTTISVDVRDGEEAGAVPVTGTITLTVTPVNDQPTASNTTQGIGWTEDDSSVALADIVVGDVDTGEQITATLTLADPLAGSLSTGGGGSYTPGTGVWTISDTVANVNAALAAVTFDPAANHDSSTSIGVDIRDGEENGSVPL